MEKKAGGSTEFSTCLKAAVVNCFAHHFLQPICLIHDHTQVCYLCQAGNVPPVFVFFVGLFASKLIQKQHRFPQNSVGGCCVGPGRTENSEVWTRRNRRFWKQWYSSPDWMMYLKHNVIFYFKYGFIIILRINKLEIGRICHSTPGIAGISLCNSGVLQKQLWHTFGIRHIPTTRAGDGS